MHAYNWFFYFSEVFVYIFFKALSNIKGAAWSAFVMLCNLFLSLEQHLSYNAQVKGHVLVQKSNGRPNFPHFKPYRTALLLRNLQNISILTKLFLAEKHICTAVILKDPPHGTSASQRVRQGSEERSTSKICVVSVIELLTQAVKSSSKYHVFFLSPPWHPSCKRKWNLPGGPLSWLKSWVFCSSMQAMGGKRWVDCKIIIHGAIFYLCHFQVLFLLLPGSVIDYVISDWGGTRTKGII